MRVSAETAPDDGRWAPFSLQYKAHKKKNAHKILTLHGYLRGTLNYRIEDTGTAWDGRYRGCVAHWRVRQLESARGR